MIEKSVPRLALLFYDAHIHSKTDLFGNFKESVDRSLAEAGLEVAQRFVIGSMKDAEKAVQSIRRDDIDLVLTVFCSWILEEVPIYLANSLSEPLMLWSPTNYVNLELARQENILLSGIVTTASNLKRIGRRFYYALGSPEVTVGEVATVARAASVARIFRNCKVGLIGLSCPGMIDSAFDELALAALGPRIARLDLTELIQFFHQASEEEATRIAVDMAGTRKVVEPDHQDLVNAAKMYLALKQIAVDHDVDVLGVRCWPELRSTYEVLPCFGISRLMDEGIMGVCENDPTGGLSMLISYHLSGQPVYLGDLGVIPSPQELTLWHCGQASPCLAQAPEEIALREHRWRPGLGVHQEFPVRMGPVTLMKLTKPINGRMKMLVSRGESAAPPDVRGCVASIRTGIHPLDFVKTMIDEDIEHHLVVAKGDIAKELSIFCDLLDFEEVEV